MSSTSLNDLGTKNINESLSQNDGSEKTSMGGYSNSTQGNEDKSSLGSTERSSIYENSPSTRSVGMRVLLLSTSGNSVNEKIESAIELGDLETSTKRLQTGFDSFTSHTISDYDQKLSYDSNKIIEAQVLNGDLHLPLSEEQDASFDVCKNLCTKKRLTNNGDPIENLVSATLAFREASHNQCDLLRAQTSAINRLATAIEDQNVMMTRFHSFAQKKKSTEHIENNDIPSRDDKQ